MLTGGNRRKWLRQPPEGRTRLRESHWLADDVLFVATGQAALYRGAPITPSAAAPRALGGISNAPFHDGINFEPDGSAFELYAIDEVAPTGLTLVAWNNGQAGTSNDPLLCVGSSVNGYVFLRRSSAEAMQAGSSTSGGLLATASASGGFTASVWRQGAATFTSSTSRAAYLNGGNKGTNATSSSPGNLNRIAIFAAYRGGSATAVCSTTIHRMALPLVLSRVLSDAEVQALYEEQLADPWGIFERPRVWVPLQASGGSGTTISAGVGDAVAAGHAVSVSLPVVVAAGVGAATAAGHAATVTRPTPVVAGVGAATAAGHAATITRPTPVAAGTGNAVAQGHAATINVGLTVACGVGNAVAAGHQAHIGLGTPVQAGVGAAAAQGHAAKVSRPIVIAAGVGAATAAGLSARLALPTVVAAGVGAAVAAGHAAQITVGVPEIDFSAIRRISRGAVAARVSRCAVSRISREQ